MKTILLIKIFFMTAIIFNISDALYYGFQNLNGNKTDVLILLNILFILVVTNIYHVALFIEILIRDSIKEER